MTLWMWMKPKDFPLQTAITCLHCRYLLSYKCYLNLISACKLTAEVVGCFFDRLIFFFIIKVVFWSLDNNRVLAFRWYIDKLKKIYYLSVSVFKIISKSRLQRFLSYVRWCARGCVWNNLFKTCLHVSLKDREWHISVLINKLRLVYEHCTSCAFAQNSSMVPETLWLQGCSTRKVAVFRSILWCAGFMLLLPLQQ